MAGWQWFGRIHTSIYRATGGIIGGNLVGLPMLLLTTTGRKSGEPRTSPLPYFEDDGHWIVVGSNNGGPRNPFWWMNMQAKPEAEIQVRRETIQVVARLAAAEERNRLWPLLVEFNSPYATYGKKTTREIPVVVLSRIDGG